MIAEYTWKSSMTILLDSLQKLAVHSLIHAAGVTSDKMILNQRASDARVVFAPKVDALEHFASSLVHKHPIENVHLFSSLTALLGNTGQSNYAAANSCIDGIVSSLVSVGLNANSGEILEIMLLQ